MADLALPGKVGISTGKLIVRGDSVQESNWEMTMKIGAFGLPTTTTCCMCADNNPFFEIHRGSLADNAQFYKVYDSDVSPATTNPSYAVVKISG